jgi:hypothetical protein
MLVKKNSRGLYCHKRLNKEINTEKLADIHSLRKKMQLINVDE